ncbi:MAG: sterol desaturase family protein [bacterium]|nr:sterol desaturase family protein [bacterium]
MSRVIISISSRTAIRLEEEAIRKAAAAPAGTGTSWSVGHEDAPSGRGTAIGVCWEAMSVEHSPDAAPNERIPGSEPGRRHFEGFEAVLAVAGFPVLISLTVGAAILAIHRGIDPNLATLGLIVAGYAWIAVAEQLWPLHRSWLRSRGDLRTDIGLAITNGLLGGMLSPMLWAAIAVAAAALSDAVGSGLWPSDWPLVAQLIPALFIAEFVEYSFHRIWHEVPWLWPIHATHHSAPRLYWLNAARFHPIDLFAVGTLKMVPLAILGAGLPIFALMNLFSAIHGAYQHSNLPVRIGPLNWIFSMAELHRWHHSKNIEEANTNYGGNLILWDVILGTRFLPDDRDPPEAIGIGDLPGFPMGFWANLASPFRWQRLSEEAADPKAPDAAR